MLWGKDFVLRYEECISNAKQDMDMTAKLKHEILSLNLGTLSLVTAEILLEMDNISEDIHHVCLKCVGKGKTVEFPQILQNSIDDLD